MQKSQAATEKEREEAPWRSGRQEKVGCIHFSISQEAWGESMYNGDPDIQGRGKTGCTPAGFPVDL